MLQSSCCLVSRWGKKKGSTLPNYKQETARWHEWELGPHYTWVSAPFHPIPRTDRNKMDKRWRLKQKWSHFSFFTELNWDFVVLTDHLSQSHHQRLERDALASGGLWTHNPDPHQTACHGMEKTIMWCHVFCSYLQNCSCHP